MPSYEFELHKFEGFNTQVLGISVDHIPGLRAWAESLEGITYPLLSDFWPHGAVAEKYGVLRDDGRSERALFIIDTEGIIRYLDIHDIDEQPDNEELFTALRKLVPDAVVSEPLEETESEPPDSVSTKASRIVLYCRPGCIDCRLARRFLERNGVAYEEINVRADPEAEARVRHWTGGDLVSPVFNIGGTIVIDFKRSELVGALGLS